MGRRDRERIERIRKGLEDPIYRQKLADRSYKGVVKELSKGSTDDQLHRLDTMVGEGSLETGRLKKTIMDKAPKEMDKAIQKFTKKGIPITVDTLCAEIRSNRQFLNMCQNVGLDISWFENLAKIRMEANGL